MYTADQEAKDTLRIACGLSRVYQPLYVSCRGLCYEASSILTASWQGLETPGAGQDFTTTSGCQNRPKEERDGPILLLLFSRSWGLGPTGACLGTRTHTRTPRRTRSLLHFAA